MAVVSISMIGIVIIIAVGVSIITAIVASKRKKLENPPLLTDKATVSSKRYDYNGGSITYCVTFNVIGKSTVELRVPENQFDVLNEGDFGTLAYQGKKFYGFTK